MMNYLSSHIRRIHSTNLSGCFFKTKSRKVIGIRLPSMDKIAENLTSVQRRKLDLRYAYYCCRSEEENIGNEMFCIVS